jgi:hypothetical protein
MLRNTLISLGIHILILMVSSILYSTSSHPAFLGFVVLLSFTGYVLLGNIFLQSTGRVVTNVLSVSIVSSIGLMIGLYCWLVPSQMGFNWMIYLVYNSYSFALAQIFQFSPKPITTFWFFIFPTLFLWFGLQLKRGPLKI